MKQEKKERKPGNQRGVFTRASAGRLPLSPVTRASNISYSYPRNAVNPSMTMTGANNEKENPYERHLT